MRWLFIAPINPVKAHYTEWSESPFQYGGPALRSAHERLRSLLSLVFYMMSMDTTAETEAGIYGNDMVTWGLVVMATTL